MYAIDTMTEDELRRYIIENFMRDPHFMKHYGSRLDWERMSIAKEYANNGVSFNIFFVNADNPTR